MEEKERIMREELTFNIWTLEDEPIIPKNKSTATSGNEWRWLEGDEILREGDEINATTNLVKQKKGMACTGWLSAEGHYGKRAASLMGLKSRRRIVPADEPGWRMLDVGEVVRNGDVLFSDSLGRDFKCDASIGLQVVKRDRIRRKIIPEETK
jgi:hypothetical protein